MAAQLQFPFADVVLNQGDIVTGSVGGPEFSTDTTMNHGGYEQRNANWMIPLGRWELGQRGYCQSTKDYLLSFFRQRRGRFQGFLWRDLADWQASAVPTPSQNGFTTQGFVVATGPGVGQLIKRYSDGLFIADRPIYKPVATSLTLPAGLVLGSLGQVTGPLLFENEFQVSFDFYTPVRFDTDSLRMSLRATEGEPGESDYEAIFDVESLSIVELRRVGASGGGSGGGNGNGGGGNSGAGLTLAWSSAPNNSAGTYATANAGAFTDNDPSYFESNVVLYFKVLGSTNLSAGDIVFSPSAIAAWSYSYDPVANLGQVTIQYSSDVGVGYSPGQLEIGFAPGLGSNGSISCAVVSKNFYNSAQWLAYSPS